jgi:acyl-CoA synthetase (AMP-forming)/AMP-acid ligase II
MQFGDYQCSNLIEKVMNSMETIGSQARKALISCPEKLAVKYKDIQFTYKELGERAFSIANALHAAGLNKGDRFGILMSNRHEHIELDLAAAFGGFIKVPLNYRLHPKEHEYMIDQSGLSLLIGERELIQPINTSVKSIFVGEGYEKWLADHPSTDPKVEVSENDLFAIMYTSGTTGKPKGVMLSHRNMLAGALSLNMVCEVTENDIVGHVAPLTHGSNFLSHVSWFHGLTQVIFDKFQPEEFIDEIEKEKVSIIFLVPTMVNLMIQHPSFNPEKLKTIKSINMAGSPIAASKLNLAIEKLGPKFIETYGQVEAPMTISMMPRHELGSKLESCGKTGPFVDMKIVDDSDQELQSGQVGEVICKGSLVMEGYWDKEEATASTLKNGWLYTGDLGWKDDKGYLHLVDRKKDVIISGGVNIYPREIEEVLNLHPGIKETCVIGLPDDKWGESVAAFVVTNETEDVTQEELIALCKEHLASFKKPKSIQIVDSLPKSSYGKILKRELRDIQQKVMKL